MRNMEVAQHVEAPKSVEPTVWPVSRFKELPIWKRGITLATLGLSTIAAACSGTAGNETTTAPPPTSSPTTITTEAPTTTSEAPSTTTTPTTVPETIPTTDPLEVCRASGDIYNGDARLTKLGMVDVWDTHSINTFDYYIMLVKPVSLNKRTIDYQGISTEVYSLSVCEGEYKDSTLYIREYMLGIPGESTGFYIEKNWTRNFNAITDDDPLTLSDNETIALINQMIEEGREIGLYVIKKIPERPGRDPKWIAWSREVEEKIPYNDNTYNDLLSQDLNGVIQIKAIHEGEPEMGSLQSITVFPLIGGW